VADLKTAGRQAIAVAADVSVESDVIRLFDECDARLGRIDALDTMTTGLAKEVAEEGIRVNAVRAGHVYTELHPSGGEPGRVKRVKHLVAMKSGGQPEEIARAILWLLSDEASFTTSAFLHVAGGN
jgi:NAD(P)-dependent dehydrogenase (short-subunit alcohol dehydrogenase family)